MKFLPLLARGRLPEEAWLYSSFIGSVGVLLKPKTPSMSVRYAVKIKRHQESISLNRVFSIDEHGYLIKYNFYFLQRRNNLTFQRLKYNLLSLSALLTDCLRLFV
jgi:hypothetical protein